MKRSTALLLLTALGCLLASTSGCAGGSSREGVYYGNGGTIHSDAYPETFGWGGTHHWGRPGPYRY
jgi:hypothetical protein